MPVQEQKVTGDRVNDNSAGWTYTAVPGLIGGLNQAVRSDLVDASEVVNSSNVFSQEAEVKSETGYAPFSEPDINLGLEDDSGLVFLETGDPDVLILSSSGTTGAVKGKPRKPYTFVKADGSQEELLFANTRVYRLINGTWHFISNGTTTTTTATLGGGGTQLTVVDTTGFTAAEPMGVALDNGSQHKTTIASVDSGTLMTMDDAVPAGENVAIGAVVMEAAKLSATLDSFQFSIATIVAQDWVVFTNGIDAVQKYDGTSLSVLGGLSTINVDTCVALATFHSYLLLLAPTISGTAKPQQVRWCDTGAYEVWNSGNAGFEELFDTDNILVRGALLGPYLYLYRSRSIVRCELIGQLNKIFNFDTMVRGEGTVAHDGVIIVEDKHLVWGQIGIYEYNGGFVVKDISQKLENLVFGVKGDLDVTNRVSVTGRFVSDLEEVWFFYPSTGNVFPNKFVRYRVDTKAFWIRDLPINVAGIGDLLPVIRVRDANVTILCEDAIDGQTFEYNLISIDDNGATIVWNIDTKDFFNPYWEAVVDSLDLVAAGTEVVVSYSKNRGKTWIEYGTVALTDDIDKYNIFGQFLTNTIRWRFAGTAPGFRLQGFGFKHKALSRDELS